MVPIYAQVCADSFVHSLNDLGRLGLLSRAVLAAQLQKAGTPDMSTTNAGWQRSNRHMLLRKAAITAEHRLHVRYDQAWQPGASFLDLYELPTTCVAARSIPVDLSVSQRLVISPLWRVFGYTIKAYMHESNFTCLVDMQEHFSQQMQDISVSRAYILMLHVCCSATCATEFAALLDIEQPQQPPSLALLDPIAMSSHVDSLPTTFRRLPPLMELAHVRRWAAATTQSHNIGCFYVVDWCPCPVPSAAGFKLLHRLGIHMQGSLPHGQCLQVSWQPSILRSF